jgi:MoxR-like ATPase
MNKTTIRNTQSVRTATEVANRKTDPGAEERDVREISTLNGEKLIVTDQDVVFDAAKCLFHEHGLGNIMFLGEAGSGKTRRAESLTLGENFPIFLAGTPLEGIHVHVHMIEVDLISTSASAELLYDSTLEAGSFARNAAVVADFIMTHGTTDRAAFEEKQQICRETLRSGEGEYHLYLLVVDDFDRTYRELQNAFLRLIHGVRHTFHRLKNTPPYYLRLQCVATSNSGLGTPSGKYTAAAGKIDAAVANRFTVYSLPDPDFAAILSHRFPGEPSFCQTMSNLIAHAKQKQRDGELESMGEISLRQALPLIEHKIRHGLSDEDAASRLFAALPPEGDERTQANLVLSRFFGRRRGSMGEFTF